MDTDTRILGGLAITIIAVTTLCVSCNVSNAYIRAQTVRSACADATSHACTAAIAADQVSRP